MDNFFVIVGATFLLAGLVKGVVGLGLPTVAVALLGIVMTPMQAAGLLLVPSLVTNAWQLAAGPAAESDGLPLWLFFGGLLVAFASSRPLTAFADRVLAARASATACPDEAA